MKISEKSIESIWNSVKLLFQVYYRLPSISKGPRGSLSVLLREAGEFLDQVVEGEHIFYVDESADIIVPGNLVNI